MDQSDEMKATRRQALRIGAVGAAAVVSIRPALAQATGSILNCEIPISNAGGSIAPDGSVVPVDTPGSFPATGTYTGEQVKAAIQSGRTLPGVDAQRSQAYTNYISRLQQGQSGFTCFASLQNPRR